MEGIEGFEKWVIDCTDYALRKVGFYGIIKDSWHVLSGNCQKLTEDCVQTHINISFDAAFRPLGTYGPAVHNFTMTDIDKIAECYGNT